MKENEILSEKIEKLKILLRSQSMGKALEQIKEIISINPRLNDLYPVMINLCLRTGEFKIPVEWVIKAVVLEPKLRNILSVYARKIINTRHLVDSLAVYSAFCQLYPENEEYLLNAAKAHLAVNNLQEASDYAMKALVINKNSEEGCVILGQIFMARKNYKYALRSFKDALDINPSSAIAKAMLQDLAKKGFVNQENKEVLNKDVDLKQVGLIKKENPRLSAQLLIYNEVEFIKLYLDNTVPFVDELVIVDGGSTDGTLECIQNYNSEKIKLYVWRQEGVHYSKGWHEYARRNLAIMQSTGDWLLKKDVDEFFLESDYQKIRKIMDENQDILYCFPRYNFWADINQYRINIKDDPHWYPDAQGNLWRANLHLKYSTDQLHSYLCRDGEQYHNTQFYPNMHIYHYHWALGKRVKVNDLRTMDLVADKNYNQIPSHTSGQRLEANILQWDKNCVEVMKFWGDHPDVIKRIFNIDEASLHQKGIEELKDYLKIPEKKIKQRYFTSVDYLGKQWSKKNPRSEKQLLDFYKTTDGYIYNLLYWHNLNIRKQLTRRIINNLGQNKIKSVLDYGCGIGGDSLDLAMAGFNVTSMDVPGKTFDFAKWRIKRYNANIKTEEIKEHSTKSLGKFEAVVCLDVLAHVKYPYVLLKKLINSLKKGGIFVFSNDCSDTDKNQSMHLRENIAIHDEILEFFPKKSWRIIDEFYPVYIFKKL